MRRLLLMMLAALALVPASAFAVEPSQIVGGAGSNWFSGSLIQQPGTNCATAILGEAYPEIMVSGVASYGGAANGGLVNVGEGYYTSLMTGVPGNPCGSGSSVIATDVLLPPGTSVDTSRPIRCFGLHRNATAWEELTGATWNHLGFSGPWCPTQVSSSIYVQGGVSVGYRPQASGQLYQIFLPVVTNQTLFGMGDNTHAFRWATTATGVYANPGLSTVWANVFPTSQSGQTPYVYFAREPAAQPFWKADAPSIPPPDTRNRAEFWANFYTAGKAGVVSYQIHRTDTMALVWDSATQDLSFNGNVGAGQDLVQILPTGSAVGPNGGYVPVAFDFPAEWNVPMRITWTFDPAGADPAVSATADFRTLAGPDTDGDGVADVTDTCATVKGTLANGCLPALVEDPDKDGVFGAADKCPTIDGKGSLDGCPPPVVTPPPPPSASPTPIPPPPALKATLGVPAGGPLARSGLAKGLSVPVTCTRDARVSLTLRLAKSAAKRLGLASPKAGLVVATGAGTCKGGVLLKLKLTFKKALRARLARRGATVPATLTTLLVTPDGTRFESKLAVKLR
jgi:hypothetical protein